MGKIGKVHDAVYQGITNGHESIYTADRQAVYHLLQKLNQGYRSFTMRKLQFGDVSPYQGVL
jgi:hypothetical protein